MTTTICLIAEDVTVSVRAMAEGIKKAGTECYTARLNGFEGNSGVSDASFLILCLSETVKDASVRSVATFCKRADKKLFIYGSAQQILNALGLVSEGVISGTFTRPMNASDIAGKIFDIVMGEDGYDGSYEDDDENEIADNILSLEDGLDEPELDVMSVTAKKHILAVDDSGPMLRTIKGWFEPDYKVSVVNSAVNAFTFLANNKPDIILLDYDMPACSGTQFMQMMRADDKLKNIPVFFLTEKGDKKTIIEVLSLHPQGYLLKSMLPADIIGRIDEFFIKGR